MNEARLRMARIPRRRRARREQGLGRAGLPDRQRHRDGGRARRSCRRCSTRLRRGSRPARACCRRPFAPMPEGDYRHASSATIAKAHPEVAIGSYPFFDAQHGPNTRSWCCVRAMRQSSPRAKAGGAKRMLARAVRARALKAQRRAVMEDRSVAATTAAEGLSGLVGPVPSRCARAGLAARRRRAVSRRSSASPAAASFRPASSRASSASG